ncbi:MAG: 2Fe-2S iron-sulfur cluster binding domain-containing protein, partial [Alphaproteobacteria bacterium]|nr:2Fe-2S iron-sulfur cluster binding domain-containing protein [Alphaproteobacteria bacterium]
MPDGGGERGRLRRDACGDGRARCEDHARRGSVSPARRSCAGRARCGAAGSRRMTAITLRIDGSERRAEPGPVTLQALLADALGERLVRRGCGEGACGSCLVLLNGEPVLSCLVPAAVLEAASIETARSVLSDPQHAPLVGHLLARGAFQCGYCAPGFLVAAAHLLAGGTALDEAKVREALSGHLCRCSGYTPIVDAVLAAHRGEPVREIGTRDDLRAKLDGRAVFPTDPPPQRPGHPSALVAGIRFGEDASASISSIDVDAACAVPGVHAVLTARDLPGGNIGGVDVFDGDQPVLADTEIRSTSDALALVAAEDDAALAAALAAISVHATARRPVLDLDEALADHRRVIAGRSNVIVQFSHRLGDVVATMASADLVIEATIDCAAADHLCLERDGGAASWDGDTLVLRVPSQAPHLARAAVARATGLPDGQIRIEAPRAGGSFGRHLVAGFECHLAVLALRTRRDVRLVLSRLDALKRGPKRNDFRARCRMAVKDGRIAALEADMLVDSGPYASVTPSMASLLASEAAGPYAIPAQRVVVRALRTNGPVTAPMRGYGSLQVGLMIERLVDKAARRAGIDPGDFRLANLKRHRHDGEGRIIPGAGPPLRETLQRATALRGPAPSMPAPWRVGRGLAVVHAKYGYPYGLVDRVAVKLAVGPDGTFVVSSDVSDSGTGVAAMIARRAAERLDLSAPPRFAFAQTLIDDPTGDAFATGRPAGGVRAGIFRAVEFLSTTAVSRVLMRLAPISSDRYAKLLRLASPLVNGGHHALMAFKAWLFPFARDTASPSISGSRSLFLLGTAARNAAAAFEKRALAVDPGSYRLGDWRSLASAAGGTLEAIGTAALPPGRLLDPTTGNQIGPADFMDGTHACDVAVHPLTGEVRVLRHIAVHDLGRVHDLTIAEGQVRGGTIMGLGLGFGEALAIEDGVVTTKSLREINLATTLDAPDEFVIEMLESGLGLGPDGAKGIGEAATVAAPIALVSAISDALGVE